MTQVGFPQTKWRIRLLNRETGSVARSLLMVNSSFLSRGDAMRGCEFDGHFIYAHYIFGASPKIIKATLASKGGNLVEVERATPHNKAIQDMCFDGEFWWRLSTSNFRKYKDWTFNDANFFLSFTHSLSGEKGIMWTGNKIGIVAT